MELAQHILNSAKPVILYWYAPTCGYCHTFWPILSAWAAAKGVDIIKLDLKQYLPMAEKYGVDGVPLTMVLIKGKEVTRSHAQTAADLDRIWGLVAAHK